ncbi:hypothetical protein B0H14DRAFT_2674253 [Mycena olivaceomarginata]|nr:hypothetical protein B0H14DRAFT_2674253 [Mycena olivaceomarginata]
MSSGLNGSLGALEIGSVLGAFLFGIETLQTYNYYRDFSRDCVLLRSTVAVVWFLELGHTVSSWHALYSETVTLYGEPQHISSPPLSEDLTVLLTALIYIVVQTFFANRVRILSGSWYFMAVAFSLNVLRFIANMGSVTILVHYRRVSILLEWRWLVWTGLSFGLAVDVLITVSMCYYLQKMRWSTESTRARKMVERLMVWTIETTLLTSATGIMQIILFTTRTDLVWTIFFIIQTKLFSNSMLASLNGRGRFRALADEPSEMLHFVSFGPEASKAGMVVVSLSPNAENVCRIGGLSARARRCPRCFGEAGSTSSNSCISDIRFLERSMPREGESTV